MREQVEALEDHPHAPADLALNAIPFGSRSRLRRRRIRRPSIGHPAGLEPLQAVEAAEERALAAARWPDDGGHLAPVHRQAHAPEDLDRPVPLDQINDFDHAHTPPFAPRRAQLRSDHRENHESGTLINM